MDTIDMVRRRQPGAFAALIAKIRAAGTDNLSFFGGGYEKEGGYSLQQHPEEFAALTIFLGEPAHGLSPKVYLEVGAASGGSCRFLHETLGFERVIVIDDHGHHRWTEQADNLGAVKRTLGPHGYAEFIGDSHGPAAAEFLAEQCCYPGSADHGVGGGCETLDLAFVDGDHSYAGITADLALVRPYVRPGRLVVLHDIVACEGVRRAWHEATGRRGWLDPAAAYIGSERPLGIGVGRVR